MADHDEYQPPTIISRELDVPLRTLERWAREGRIRTRPSPTRKRAKLYHRAEAEMLAAATVRQSDQPEPEATTPEPPTPSTEIVPQGDLLRMLDDTQRRLDTAMHEAGIWRGRFEQLQRLLEDRVQLRTRAEAELERTRATVEAEQERLRAELERTRADIERLPWLLRIFFLRRR